MRAARSGELARARESASYQDTVEDASWLPPEFQRDAAPSWDLLKVDYKESGGVTGLRGPRYV